MYTIQDIDPARVIYALCSQSLGTYIVRHSTPNDDITTKIEIDYEKYSNISSRSFVVLSVRVDEFLYKYKIVNYRLPLTEDLSQLLQPYYRLENNPNFTSLTNEFHVTTDNSNWEIDTVNEFTYQRIYLPIFGVSNSSASGSMAQWRYSNENIVDVFVKNFKDDRYFYHEFNILKELCFCHIVEVCGYYQNLDLNCKSIVMIDGGKSLVSFCPLTEECVLNYGFQIANGLIYLEQKNIIHRDLVASNVLLHHYGNVRIADFGHAIKKEPNQDDSLDTEELELEFRLEICAPECMPSSLENERTNIESKRNALLNEFSFKSDIWAFGLLLVQLMNEKGSKIYPKLINDYELIEYIKTERQICERPSKCSDDIYQILKQCWIYEPDERISSLDVRNYLLKLFKNIVST